MLTQLFQNYVELKTKIHSLLTVEKVDSLSNVVLKNIGKLFGILGIVSLIILAFFTTFQEHYIIGNFLIIIAALIIYGVDEGYVYYNELFYCAGIPMAIMNFFIGLVQVIFKYGKHASDLNRPIIDGWSLFASLILFLLGIIILMTAASRPYTKILPETKGAGK